MKLQKNQSLLFLGSVAFLSIILILQVNGETNYNTFFLESEQLRLVGENYRGGDRTPSPVVEPQETQDDQVQYPLPFDENSPVSKCYSKHISTLTNSYGQILKTVESQTDIMEFDENSPLTPLTIVTDKNEVATKLNVKLLAYCETNNLYPFVTRNLNVLDSSDLTVRVFSSDSNNNNYEKTAIKKVDVRTTNLNPNFLDKWNEYGNVTIDLKTINDMIEGTQPLDSMQRIQVSGIMKIEFKDENKAWTWNFKIDPASSKYGSTQNSYVQVKVIPTYKNTGGSGGFDYPEPTTPETNTHTGEQEQACIALGGILSGNLCTITPETPDPETPETPTDQEKCNKLGGELKDGLCQITIEKDGKVSDESNEPKELDYGILNYKKLLNCDSADCYNDADFLPIYALFGAILLLGVFQTKQQSRVVMMS